MCLVADDQRAGLAPDRKACRSRVTQRRRRAAHASRMPTPRPPRPSQFPSRICLRVPSQARGHPFTDDVTKLNPKLSADVFEDFGAAAASAQGTLPPVFSNWRLAQSSAQAPSSLEQAAPDAPDAPPQSRRSRSCSFVSRWHAAKSRRPSPKGWGRHFLTSCRSACRSPADPPRAI